MGPIHYREQGPGKRNRIEGKTVISNTHIIVI
jgi:hypothetical protein